LRIKDVDFERQEILVRDGKGGKDRRTMLPASLQQPLREAIARARRLHVADLAAGHGRVWLPHALARKYPNAATEPGWQYVFPSDTLSEDPKSGITRRHHVGEEALSRHLKLAAKRLGLDEIGFKGPQAGDDASEAALTLGKRLSEDLYVTYERSLSGVLGTLYIFYDLSKHLTLRGQTGIQSAVDLIYTVRYD
ncbi:MAG: translocation/assembly module TamB domain-containing protein, partial [Achromobacter sp.]|uniref:translocation/assembly module TamB domain-containing protein n=1 Tax=Achromobacter sp. TaxID=134375 RepID=UPI0025849022